MYAYSTLPRLILFLGTVPPSLPASYDRPDRQELLFQPTFIACNITINKMLICVTCKKKIGNCHTPNFVIVT